MQTWLLLSKPQEHLCFYCPPDGKWTHWTGLQSCLSSYVAWANIIQLASVEQPNSLCVCMSVHVCMYVLLYMYIHMHDTVCVHICVHMPVCTFVCMCVCMHVPVCVCACACLCVCMCVYVCAYAEYACTCLCVYVCEDTCTCLCVYVCTCTQQKLPKVTMLQHKNKIVSFPFTTEYLIQEKPSDLRRLGHHDL